MTGNGTTCPSAPPHRERRWLRGLGLGSRFLLAAIFLMAALTKITDLGAFEEQVRLHADLPLWLETLVIHVLPWLELTCGACLALGYAVREAALLVTLLLVAFLVHALRNYAERDCGCFIFPSLVPAQQAWWPAVRNALLLLTGILVCTGPRELWR